MHRGHREYEEQLEQLEIQEKLCGSLCLPVVSVVKNSASFIWLQK